MGQDFVVTCQVKGVNEAHPALIEWYRRNSDGSKRRMPIARVQIEKQVSRDYSVVDILKLGFENFGHKDAGEYICGADLRTLHSAPWVITSKSITIKGEPRRSYQVRYSAGAVLRMEKSWISLQ